MATVIKVMNGCGLQCRVAGFTASYSGKLTHRCLRVFRTIDRVRSQFRLQNFDYNHPDKNLEKLRLNRPSYRS